MKKRMRTKGAQLLKRAKESEGGRKENEWKSREEDKRDRRNVIPGSAEPAAVEVCRSGKTVNGDNHQSKGKNRRVASAKLLLWRKIH